MTEDEMVRWHHQLDGHEFVQAPGVGDAQGSLELLTGIAESSTSALPDSPVRVLSDGYLGKWKAREL